MKASELRIIFGLLDGALLVAAKYPKWKAFLQKQRNELAVFVNDQRDPTLDEQLALSEKNNVELAKLEKGMDL